MKSVLALHTSADNDAAITLYYPNGYTKTVPSVNYNNLTLEDKTVYDSFKNMLPLDEVIFFDNLPVGIDGDMNIQATITSGTKTNIDYDSISSLDRAKIDTFVELIEKLFI